MNEIHFIINFNKPKVFQKLLLDYPEREMPQFNPAGGRPERETISEANDVTTLPVRHTELAWNCSRQMKLQSGNT